MTSLHARAKRITLALALAAALAPGLAAAQSSKDQQHARLIELQEQMQELKGASASQTQFAAAQAEFLQISTALGGDVPCAVGPSSPGSSSTRSAPPAPNGCTPVLGTFTQPAVTAIPTGPAVVTSTVLVAGAGTYLWDVDLTTFLTHSFAADIDMTITSPAGTVVTLTTDNGAGNDNVYNGTVWDDDANPTGAVPYTTNNGLVTDHAYVDLTLASPLVPEEALSAFVGENPNGTWTITISDDLAGDGGSLDSWSLGLTTFATAPVLDAVQTFNQITPVAIPTGPAVVTSTLDVAGTTNPICKVALRTTMPHSFGNDLDITLTSPSGTIVTVTTDNGAGNDNIFSGTVWDDDANPTGVVPYTTNDGMVTDHAYVNLTTATPLVVEESLGALMGETANGTWTLTVSDDLAGDGGSLDAWGLDFTTCTCSQADLSVTLTDSPDPVLAGSNLTYVATLTNGGPTDAQGANISLPLPVGTTFVSATPSAGGVCNAVSPVVCTWAGATAPAGVRTATVVVAVPANVADATVLSATATAASTTNDPNSANNTASTTTTVAASADLSITLTDTPDPVTAGTNLSYLATLTNLGPSDAQAATITLPLPAGTSFVSATPSAGGSCNAASPVVCSWAGATTTADTRTVTVVAAVSSAQTAALSATATASSSTPDAVAGNNAATAATAVQVQADLSITLADAPDPVTAGTQLTYTAVVSNAGPSDATGVSVSLPLPPGTSFVSGSVTGGGTCAGSPVVCSVSGSVAPASSRTVSVVVLVAASVLDGTVLNATATVAATSPDPNAADNSASTTTNVIAVADLTLTFTGSATQAAINVPVTFTATSLNQGPSDAQDVIVTITLTPDFRYGGHTATGATCTTPQVGNTGAIVCTWAGATAPGATRTLVVTAFSNTEGQTAVTASTTSSTTDPTPNNNFGNLTVQVGYLVEEIPTLSGLGLILMGLLFGLMGFVAVRRQA